MDDREKVVKGLENLPEWLFRQYQVVYDGDASNYYDAYKTVDEALAMLKEQEPILLENRHKPYGISTNANSPWISRCPKCGKKVEGKQTRFCKYCGQAVKWE